MELGKIFQEKSNLSFIMSEIYQKHLKSNKLMNEKKDLRKVMKGEEINLCFKVKIYPNLKHLRNQPLFQCDSSPNRQLDNKARPIIWRVYERQNRRVRE